MTPNLAKNSLIYPLHYLRREPIARYLAEVNAVNRLSREEIEQYQRGCLFNILHQAHANHNQAYHQIRKSLPQLREETAMEVLRELPLQSKEKMRDVIQNNGKPRGIATDYRSTSGSTGMPFRFYKDRYATGYMDAVLYAAYGWHGIEIGDPQARFWGMPLATSDAALAQLKDLLKNRIRFSAFDLGSAAKEAYIKKIQAFRPTYFYGYPSLIAEFCSHLISTGRQLREVPLKAVIGTGEYLHQHERELICHATGVPFFNEYGCTEVGIVGFECRHGQLHLMASNIYLEVIKDGVPVFDEAGEIHVTELHARTSPFIRYNLGDRGILCSEPCSCGCALPVMQVLAGRKDDYIITPDGRKIYDAILAYTLKKGISRFSAVQTAINRIEISVIQDVDYSQDLADSYVNTLRKHLGSDMSIAIIPVKEIEREPSGKLRYFRNEIGNMAEKQLLSNTGRA